tara:strand:+ start:160 stop:348 length:189 start_codon:yes stop_codon:yes gene_type:complete
MNYETFFGVASTPISFIYFIFLILLLFGIVNYRMPFRDILVNFGWGTFIYALTLAFVFYFVG